MTTPINPGFGAGWQQPWMPPVQPAKPKPVGRIIVAALAALALVTAAAYFIWAMLINFTVAGTWTLAGDCDYTGRQINVYNTTGVLLATGRTTAATPTFGNQCVYSISVSGVPARETGYILKVPNVAYSEPLSKDQAAHLNLIPQTSLH